MGHRHISATMLGFTWTERWIDRSGPIAWPPRSPDLTPLDFFLWGYVKNIVYQVKINDLQATWNEVEYRLDICRAKGAHIEIYWESYILRKKKKTLDVFPSQWCNP
jgi:hypothetical protein